MISTEFTWLIACVSGVLIALGVLYVALKLWLDAPKKSEGLLIPEGLAPNTVDFPTTVEGVVQTRVLNAHTNV